MAEAEAAGDLLLRELTADDLPAALELSRAVQWSHRIEDWQFVHQLGQGLVIVDDKALLGTAMHWLYGSGFATLGMVIVSPERQGAGIGRRLMQATLERIGSRTALLNATEAGQPLYERLGFEPIGSIVQHQGAGFSVPVIPLRVGERLRPIGRRESATIAALDARATGLERGPLLAALLDIAEGIVLDRDGEAIGFALFRRFGRGYVIGPVVAPDIEGAKALISHWIGSRSGMLIRIDVPAGCGLSDLSDWLQDLGLAAVDGGVTMARGKPPPRPGPSRLFGLVNQALG